jgi:hypothetical protein
MTRGAASQTFNRTMFPFAWTIARAYRQGKLAEPRQWMAATGLPGESQLLLDTLEEQLGEVSVLADYSTWVLMELPPGQAHMIDADTDAYWAFLLLLASQVAANPGQALRLRVGRNVFGRRTEIFATLDAIAARGIRIAKDFSLRQFSSVVLPTIRGALQEAIAQFERQERAELVAATIDADLVRQASEAAQAEWRRSQYRLLLESVGAIHHIDRVGSGPLFGISARAPKLFFVQGSDASDNAAKTIGEDLARSIVRGEEERLILGLSGVRASGSRGRPATRIHRAIASLAAAGTPATHCLMPRRWRFTASLEDFGFRQIVGSEPLIIGDVPAYEWLDHESAFIVFLHLPEAIQIRQFLANARSVRELDVSVVEIPMNPDTDEEPTLRISAHERWSLRIVRRYARRVPLADVLRS